jgi:inward rectifier potassium channel
MLQPSSWFLRVLSMRKVLAKARKPRNERKSHLLTIGQREVETHGLDTGFWSDLYHRSVTVHWPVFFGSAAAIFVTLNAVFAFFYWLGDRPIANVSDDLPLSLFYFSIETLATVGQPTLMIRIANARHNTISQATARLWLFRLEHTKERDQLRRYYELELFRQEHPMFSLSWTLVHIIDETSAFRDMTPDKFTEVEGALVLNVGGVDDNSAQRLYARQIYSRDDIRWQHRYRDITSLSERGRLLLDYTRFHEVDPEEV